jgi:hypothetical protein
MTKIIASGNFLNVLQDFVYSISFTDQSGLSTGKVAQGSIMFRLALGLAA